MQTIRIYEMPACKMVSSGVGAFGNEKFEVFEAWMSAQKRSLFPKDFLFWDKTGFHWLYTYEAGMYVPSEFEIIDFEGGMYAVVTDVDGKTDNGEMRAAVDAFLNENGLERDPSRAELGNIITSERVSAILGYNQMDYYTPIRAKD